MPTIKRVIKIIAAFAFAAIIALKGAGVYYKMSYPIKYEEEVLKYSLQNNLDKNLVYAVIYAESRFKPTAVSNIGARGLMQITNDTFEWAKWRMGDEKTVYNDLFDPETNIKYGTYIIKLLKQEFITDEVTLAAYHAGWGSVKKWLADQNYSTDGRNIHTIPFVDTAWYVPKVLDTKSKYDKIYGSN